MVHTKDKNRIISAVLSLILFSITVNQVFAQVQQYDNGINSAGNNGIVFKKLSLKDENNESSRLTIFQKPTKKVYFTYGGKIGMFFLQGAYAGNQMIAIEGFGKYVAEQFFAEISVPFRFKTSPAFTDIGLDINVCYPFLGAKNKTEVDPYVGAGLGLHFIGKDKNDTGGTHIAARGGMGLNLIIGSTFLKNYDFNVIFEIKYFVYLREFDDKTYHGIGLTIGATFPH